MSFLADPNRRLRNMYEPYYDKCSEDSFHTPEMRENRRLFISEGGVLTDKARREVMESEEVLRAEIQRLNDENTKLRKAVKPFVSRGPHPIVEATTDGKLWTVIYVRHEDLKTLCEVLGEQAKP